MIRYLHAQALALRDFCRGPFRAQLRTAAVAFAALTLISYAAGRLLPHVAEAAVNYYVSLMEAGGLTETQVRVSTIFSNNLRAGAFCILYGLIPYVQLPALPLGINSILMGLLGAYYVNNGRTLLSYAAGIVPHGLFELPALVLSIAGGLYLCRAVTQRLRSGQKGLVRDAFAALVRVFCLWIFPLFLLAAAIETYVTPYIFTLFAG